jgi:tripartite-type tricarboxylate transporter receptor subunit TctC
MPDALPGLQPDLLSRLATVTFAIVMQVALSAEPAVAQGSISFKGKTITMLVASEPGGGTDASGRTIMPYLRRYLPGEPNIVVQNMPGASGLTALNHFVRRTQPDGLTVVMGSISMVDPMNFARSTSQYDPRTLHFVGGIGRGGNVIFINRDAEPRLFDKSKKPAVIGSALSYPRSAMQPALWCIEYLGWNATWVTGYHGTNETMLALDRGEIDITSTGNIFQIQDRLTSGQLKILNQTGAIENGKIVGRADYGNAPLFPDQMKGRISDPTAQRAFDYWMALNTGDKWLALAPGTPAGIVATYRDAFNKVTSDKEFLERGERISDGFAQMSVADVENVVRTLSDTPAEAIDFTKALMRKQGIRVQ